MREIVGQVMCSCQSDFTVHDMKALEDYNDKFIWQVAPTHTYLHFVGKDELQRLVSSENGLYNFLQRNTGPDACLKSVGKDERVFLFDGIKMFEMSVDAVSAYWESLREWTLFQWQAYHGMQKLPNDFCIQIDFSDEDCEKYFNEQLEYAKQHNDESLENILRRFKHRVKQSSDHKIVINKDGYAERSFVFREIYGGECHLFGGIIFHGYPEEGYIHNGSTQLVPSFGWQTHT